MAVTIAFSRIIGFGRWLVFSSTVGSTDIGTAYTNANTVPNVLYEVAAGGALAGAVVPLLAGPLLARKQEEANQITSALLTWALTILVPIAAIMALFAGPIASVMQVPGNQQDLVARFLVVFAPQVIFYGIGIVVTGVLQAHKRFFWPVFAPIMSSVVVIVAYLIFARQAGASVDTGSAEMHAAVQWLGWGTTAGVAAMSLPLLVPGWRTGMRLKLTWRFPSGVGRRAVNLATAGVGALLAQQLAVVATMLLANSFGGVGAHTTFLYAQTVYFLPYAVLAVPLATSAFPRLAEAAQGGDWRRYASGAAASTRAVLLVSGAGAVALVAAAPAVQSLFDFLDAGRPAGLAVALIYMAPGLLGFAIIAHVTRVLYAAEHGKTAMIATSIGWLAVIVASWLAILWRTDFGANATIVTALEGLGIGSSVGMSVAGVLLIIGLRRTVGALALAGLGRTMATLALAASSALVGWWVTQWALPASPSIISAILGGALGALAAIAVFAGIVLIGDRRVLGAVVRRDVAAEEGLTEEVGAQDETRRG
ncbi:MAG TPA: lipid II flippase MurJ [Actinomycetales bacterium]|nr:lipid II flippase MurJ [Actinomycetales bacterium]